MIAALFIATLLPFTLLKKDNGETLMRFSDFSLPDISMPDISMPDWPSFSAAREVTPSGNDDSRGKDIFYQWYDHDGNVQFTTEPPSDGVDFTRKAFDPNANVIQAVNVPVEKVATEEENPVKEQPTHLDGAVNPYSTDRISKIFEDTRAVEKLLGQRAKDQESALNL